MAGSLEDARVAAAKSARIADLTRSLFQLSIARAMGEYATWMLVGSQQSLQAIIEATAWLAPREGGLFRSLNYGWLADGLVAAGRGTEARQYAVLALLRARKRDLIGVAMAYRALARAAARDGDGGAVRRYLALATRPRKRAIPRTKSRSRACAKRTSRSRATTARARCHCSIWPCPRSNRCGCDGTLPRQRACARWPVRALPDHQCGINVSATVDPVGRSSPASSRPLSIASSVPIAIS